MYSSRDLESFYFQYQTESLSHGESLQSFCLKHKVPYTISHKWYKDTCNQIGCYQIITVMDFDALASPLGYSSFVHEDFEDYYHFVIGE